MTKQAVSPNLCTVLQNYHAIGTLAITAIAHTVSPKKIDPQCDRVQLLSKTEVDRAQAFCWGQQRKWRSYARDLELKINMSIKPHYELLDLFKAKRRASSMSDMWEVAENEVRCFDHFLSVIFSPKSIEFAKENWGDKIVNMCEGVFDEEDDL